MPKEKVREAIDDMLRRGLTDLDPMIALMRRGPAALDELALAADRPAVKDALVAAVRKQSQRFAAATASMQRGVRQHALTRELLQAAGEDALARAALLAWNEGRRDEASDLADAATAIGRETPELLILTARLAAAAGDRTTSIDRYSRALDKPLSEDFAVEAARALSLAGRTEAALLALAAGGEGLRKQFAGLAAEACLRGETRLVSAVCTAAAGADGQEQAVYLDIQEMLHDSAGHWLEGLARDVGQLGTACRDLLLTASDMLLTDDPAMTARCIAVETRDAASRASSLAASARERAGQPDDANGADQLTDTIAGALQEYHAVLAPVSKALLEIAAELQSAVDLTSVSADCATIGPGERVSLSQAVSRIASETSASCAELVALLGVAVQPARLVPQLPGRTIDDAEARSRPALSEQGLTLRVTAGASPAVRIDQVQVTAAIAALLDAVARGVPRGESLSLGLLYDPSAGVVQIHVCRGSGETLASAPPAGPLAVALADLVAARHGGNLTVLAESRRCGYVLSLPAERPTEIPTGLAELTSDAQMALRAAVGMQAAGDAKTACFLIDKGVSTEATHRLLPHLARHLLLPTAAWALSSGAAKHGLTGPGASIPGRRVEEFCRAAVDDRLQRRLSNVHAFGLCLAIFALPHKGWPQPADIPGLSSADRQPLVDGLLALAELLARAETGPALDAAQTVLRLLLQARTA